jgi:hypothetical protein
VDEKAYAFLTDVRKNTDTNHIDNRTQTKLQEVIFELHDLRKLANKTAKKTLQQQVSKLEELEKELF